MSKGTLVIPTYDGTIMLGPTADEVEDLDDVTTTTTGESKVFAGARRLVPSLSERDIIAQFAGTRATIKGDDFLIGPTEVPGSSTSPEYSRRVSPQPLPLPNMSSASSATPVWTGRQNRPSTG